METTPQNAGRWTIAIAGTALQLFLGTVYAWSYFQKPLAETYAWTNSQVAWAFSLAICFLGMAAAWGGTVLPRVGPRRLAIAGGCLFGGGYALAALAIHLRSLTLLYLGYGVVGGIGLGLGYVTPVATVAKWFPDRKGMATGMVIMGFGLGALLMSKVLAPAIVHAAGGDFVLVFLALGAVFAVATVAAAAFMRNPPAARDAAAGTFIAAAASAHADSEASLASTLLSRRFIFMWLVFFFNILGGISIIGFQSPLMQDLCHKANSALSKEALAAAGATLIGISSLFNGIGRMFWGAISDRIGRVAVFRIMLGSQVLVFGLLMVAPNPWLFGALVCYVLLCYGGGFGTMPSFVLDVFGSRRMAVVYGTILTAWSAAGVVGPQLVAFVKDRWPANASMWAFAMGAVFLFIGSILSLALSGKPFAPRQSD